MPTFGHVNGVKINIYFGEHLPPHIHCEYNDDEELLEIESFSIYEGWLPSKQHKIALGWLKENQAKAKELFYQLNPHLHATNRKYTKNNKNKRR
jgi:hypothetical protein